jgi:hypothetical protein
MFGCAFARAIVADIAIHGIGLGVLGVAAGAGSRIHRVMAASRA